MTEQPTALRLAEVSPYLEGGERGQWILDAATELRRLHAQRDALLEALKLARLMLVAHGETHAKIDAVIKAVEEGK